MNNIQINLVQFNSIATADANFRRPTQDDAEHNHRSDDEDTALPELTGELVELGLDDGAASVASAVSGALLRRLPKRAQPFVYAGVLLTLFLCAHPAFAGALLAWLHGAAPFPLGLLTSLALNSAGGTLVASFAHRLLKSR